jgi:hypothetical protein
MKLSPRDTQVNVRLSAELKRIAEEAAEADSRSMSSLIEKLLVDHLRATGYLPSTGNPAGKRK